MAPSSSPRSSSPPRKLLRIDPKPQPAAPMNSASSSSTTTVPPPEKRTRDQPNLSDCHCCGRRINHTNPKDRLQPLDSSWRIVLLCRKCRKKVNSGQTCPYCFEATEHPGGLFRCCLCQRKIHKDCAGDYRNCAPFCYLGVDMGFRVCVDCWVPDSLKNSIRTCGRSEDNDASKHKIEARDSSDKTVKDANRHVEKVRMAVNDKDQPLKKATVAHNDANNVKHSLDFVRKKERNKQKDASSDSSGRIKIFDDAELAFRLHRAINSSPRMLRDKCQVDSCSDDLNNGNSNGLSCKRLGGDQSEDQSANSAEIERNNWTDKKSFYSDCNELAGRALMYKREKKRKTWQEIRSTLPEQMNFRLQLKDSGTGRPIKRNDDIWEILVCVSSDQNGPCINTNRFGQDMVVYKRTRFRQKACQGNGMGECSSFDNWRATFESQNYQSDDITHELPLVESGTVCVASSNTEATLPQSDDITHELPLVASGTVCVASCNTEANLPQSDEITHGLPLIESGTVFVASCNTKANLPQLDDIRHELPLVESGTVCVARCNTEANLPIGNCSAENDRYFLKYARTDRGFKCGDEVILPDGSCNAESERFFVKYSKRVKCTKSGSTGPVSDTILGANQACAPCLIDLQAGYSEICDGVLNLQHGSCDEEDDRYFFKYVKRTKGSHSVPVEANLHSGTELRTINLH